ncbi:hypothetical protein [Mesorhizobium sp. M1406]|uniref:hypothetical protein n=1 Tax=Mesorhizobium sp. M1406 TaxID=2957099 RepID=UPI003334B396
MQTVDDNYTPETVCQFSGQRTSNESGSAGHHTYFGHSISIPCFVDEGVRHQRRPNLKRLAARTFSSLKHHLTLPDNAPRGAVTRQLVEFLNSSTASSVCVSFGLKCSRHPLRLHNLLIAPFDLLLPLFSAQRKVCLALARPRRRPVALGRQRSGLADVLFDLSLPLFSAQRKVCLALARPRRRPVALGRQRSGLADVLFDLSLPLFAA